MLARLGRWLRHRIGRRGAFLLFLCVLDVVYGYSLAFSPPAARSTATYRYLAEVAPLELWAAWWLITGVLCGIFAFRRRDAIGYAAAMLLKSGWAGMFFVGQAAFGLDRGYLSTLIWGSFGLLLGLVATWPEAPPDGFALDGYPDAIVTADESGRITAWFGAAEQVFGWRADQIIGRPITILVPDRFRQRHLDAVARVQAGAAPKLGGQTVDLAAVRADGIEVPIQATIGVHRAGGTCTYSAVIRELRARL